MIMSGKAIGKNESLMHETSHFNNEFSEQLDDTERAKIITNVSMQLNKPHTKARKRN